MAHPSIQSHSREGDKVYKKRREVRGETSIGTPAAIKRSDTEVGEIEIHSCHILVTIPIPIMLFPIQLLVVNPLIFMKL